MRIQLTLEQLQAVRLQEHDNTAIMWSLYRVASQDHLLHLLDVLQGGDAKRVVDEDVLYDYNKLILTETLPDEYPVLAFLEYNDERDYFLIDHIAGGDITAKGIPYHELEEDSPITKYTLRIGRRARSSRANPPITAKRISGDRVAPLYIAVESLGAELTWESPAFVAIVDKLAPYRRMGHLYRCTEELLSVTYNSDTHVCIIRDLWGNTLYDTYDTSNTYGLIVTSIYRKGDIANRTTVGEVDGLYYVVQGNVEAVKEDCVLMSVLSMMIKKANDVGDISHYLGQPLTIVYKPDNTCTITDFNGIVLYHNVILEDDRTLIPRDEVMDRISTECDLDPSH